MVVYGSLRYRLYSVTPSMPPHTSSLMPVPAKKERNEPHAAWVARLKSLAPMMSSPIKAPINGHNSGPAGQGRNIPTIRPTTAPQLPPLLPPNRRVIHGVRKKSMTHTTTVTIPHTMSDVVLRCA